MSKFDFSGDGNVTIGAVNPAGPVTIGAIGNGATSHFHGAPPSRTLAPPPTGPTASGKHGRPPKLRGLLVGLTDEVLRSRIEDDTADLIDWAAEPGTGDDLWSHEVWIESSPRGHDLTLYYKARPRFIDAAPFIDARGDLRSWEFAGFTAQRITRLAAADPTPYVR